MTGMSGYFHITGQPTNFTHFIDLMRSATSSVLSSACEGEISEGDKCEG